MLLLRAEDDPILKERLSQEAADREQGGRKIFFSYCHADVQNDLLQLMANEMLRELLSTVRDNVFFSLICDEGTDISNQSSVSC